MKDLLLQLLTALVQVGVAVVVPFVIRLLVALEEKAIQAVGQSTFNEGKDFAGIIVKAIAQKYPDLTNAGKYAKAVEAIETKFGKDIFTEQEIELLIESAVKEYKLVVGQSTSATPVPTPTPVETTTTTNGTAL